MPTKEITRVHPETGATLVRGVRKVVLNYRGQSETIDLPGWYPENDLTADHGVHDAKDMQISDRAINRMRARLAGVMVAEEVREARRKLGLSQREAGLLIGGGPKGFQKYESGEVILSKIGDTALRLLSNEPSRISELKHT